MLNECLQINFGKVVTKLLFKDFDGQIIWSADGVAPEAIIDAKRSNEDNYATIMDNIRGGVC